MIWTPRVTVAAIIEQHDQFLLVEESIQGQLVLNQPAGHLESGESLQSAIIREVWEETARHFKPVALVGIYRWPMPEGELTFLRFCFAGTVGERDLQQPLDQGILDASWKGYEVLKKHSRLRSPMVLQCIEDYRKGQHTELSLLHDVI